MYFSYVFLLDSFKHVQVTTKRDVFSRQAPRSLSRDLQCVKRCQNLNVIPEISMSSFEFTEYLIIPFTY